MTTLRKFNEAQIVEVLTFIEAGANPATFCRKYGISEETLALWKKEHGDKVSRGHVASCSRWLSVRFLMTPEELSRLLAQEALVMVRTNQGIAPGARVKIEDYVQMFSAYFERQERDWDLKCTLVRDEQMIAEERVRGGAAAVVNLIEPPVLLDPLHFHANTRDTSTPLLPVMVLQYPQRVAFSPDYLPKDSMHFRNAQLFQALRSALVRCTRPEKVVIAQAFPPRYESGWSNVALRVSDSARERVLKVIAQHPGLIVPKSRRLS